MRRAGAARLDRLVSLLERSLAGGEDADRDADSDHPDTNGAKRDAADRPDSAGDPHAADARSDHSASAGATGSHRQPTTGRAGSRRRSRPQLLIRAELDTLLDRDQTPVTLLTTLLGGHVRVTSETARRLIDERGADLRTVIIDDHGNVVGVGRKQRVARGWLRDMALALHDTCTAPTCDVAARVCTMDHATPWFPVRPTDPPGRTDVDEIAPMCGLDNHTKERDGWRAEQQADGTRRWTHDRSGLTIRTLPATWRPRSGAPEDRGPPADDPG
jgi:hypothetical protein